jgi:hypothetical protein
LTAAVTLLKRATQIHHIAIKSHGWLVSEKGFRLVTGALDSSVRSDSGTEGFDMRGDGGGEGNSHGRRCYRKKSKCRMLVRSKFCEKKSST